MESTPEAFSRQLNAKLAALEKTRSKYELQFNHQLGLCAYLVIDKTIQVPETIAEEFEIAGETHTCLDCPFWRHPKDGRVKYTRCEITPGIHGASSPACDAFYEKLFKGEIEIGKEDGK